MKKLLDSLAPPQTTEIPSQLIISWQLIVSQLTALTNWIVALKSVQVTGTWYKPGTWHLYNYEVIEKPIVRAADVSRAACEDEFRSIFEITTTEYLTHDTYVLKAREERQPGIYRT